MTSSVNEKGPNPVFWLVWTLPALAVVASFTSLYFALRGGDVPLPANYHWEGQAIDADQTLQERAKVLGIAAVLQYDRASGQCRVLLRGDAPAQLRVDLAHPTEPVNDRHWIMSRDDTGYHSACTPPANAHWWLQISDSSGHWQLRARVHGDFSRVEWLTAGSRAG